MRITFLGTSAGVPTRQRNVTCQVLQFDHGGLWLLDCGEASQHQLMRAGLRAARIERILITHLHGDHCYGLPGMLSCIAIAGRKDPLDLIGPPGLRELVETVCRLSEAHLPFTLNIHEIHENGLIFQPIHHWQVQAVAIPHRIRCFGYHLQEGPRPGRFHEDRASALGLPHGPLRARLLTAGTVTLPDGRTIAADQVCDPPRRGRSVVLLGDTSDPSPLLAVAHGCDVVVCEATYDAGREAKAAAWGHCTTTIAARFATAIAARTLILTHFSSRYDDAGLGIAVADLLAEAQAAAPGLDIHAAQDLWQFTVSHGDGEGRTPR